MRTFSLLMLGSFVVGGALVAAGCQRPAGNVKPAVKKGKSGEEEHAHKAGGHGGRIFAVGADAHHVEAILEKGGKLRVLILGSDESKVEEIESRPLQAHVRVGEQAESTTINAVPEPQVGDKQGFTSQLVIQLPPGIAGKTLDISIPNVPFSSGRFRVAMRIEPPEGHTEMPAKVEDEAEAKLYLTPGGKYTEADIKANGYTTASRKFQGIRAEHDDNPQTGDKICPISKTKANAKFTWVVDGKGYEFCCPPCVDEFVSQAKEKPASLKSQEEFRKK